MANEINLNNLCLDTNIADWRWRITKNLSSWSANATPLRLCSWCSWFAEFIVCIIRETFKVDAALWILIVSADRLRVSVCTSLLKRRRKINRFENYLNVIASGGGTGGVGRRFINSNRHVRRKVRGLERGLWRRGQHSPNGQIISQSYEVFCRFASTLSEIPRTCHWHLSF